MEILRVNGGRRLSGEARLMAAKNAVLPIMAASILTEDKVTLEDVPQITDATHMAEILEILGCRVTRFGRTLTIDSGTLDEGLAEAQALAPRAWYLMQADSPDPHRCEKCAYCRMTRRLETMGPIDFRFAADF